VVARLVNQPPSIRALQPRSPRWPPPGRAPTAPASRTTRAHRRPAAPARLPAVGGGWR